MQIYRMRLNNPYLGDKIVALPGKDEVAARSLATRMNKGYTVSECEVYNPDTAAQTPADAGEAIDITDDLFGDE